MFNFDGLFNFSHYIDPAKKDAVWAANVINELYQFGNAKSLLEGKNISEILALAEGTQSSDRYKMMFRGLYKEMQAAASENGLSASREVEDITGLDWDPVPILTTPMNSAITTIQKTPLYVKATAIDGLAQENKRKDRDYIRQRPYLDRTNAALSDQTGIPLTSPNAPNNAENVDIKNFDLDPQKEDELNFFMNMFHRLRPESAFETVLGGLSNMLGLKKTADLEAIDQFRWGVSTNQNGFSQMTGLPLTQYVFPGDVYTPDSNLKDFSDQPFRFVIKQATCEDIMNAVGNEMDQEMLVSLFDSYHKTKGITPFSAMDSRERKHATIPLCYMEFKTWDVEKYHTRVNRKYQMRVTLPVQFAFELRYGKDHPETALRGTPKKATKDEYISEKYVQRTLTAYWFAHDPDRIYRYKELEGSYREAGRESLSPFSINIFRSQKKGAVELCAGAVHEWHRSYFKMQHCIIKSKPAGMFIDMRYIRNAAAQSVDAKFPLSVAKLMKGLAENNTFIGDSEGIDPDETMSGSRPFYEIKGGVGAEIDGYILTMNEAMKRIEHITGINSAITGGNTNNSNPEGLVGLQKLLLQSGLNSIFYAQQARKEQTEKVYRVWANLIQHILRHKNTASYRALESMIGSYKVAVLEDLDSIPVHMWAIMVENAPTEVEQEELNNMLNQMFVSQNINSVDYVTLKRIFNVKDAQQLLAIRERKNRERQQQERQDQNDAMVQAAQIDSQTKMQVAQVVASAPVKAAGMKVEGDKWKTQYEGQLQQILARLNGEIKSKLQDDRGRDQLQKNKQTADLKHQAPIAAA